ncbi:MAG: helix-turn-helix domain-containing protein [Bacillus sp. (in: firmicutes)]
MVNKAEILIHPVRIKISQALMRNKKTGLTPLEMVKIIKDVPQATLYRHIQVLLESGVIRILKEKKVRAVSEKYYTINEEEVKISSEEWKEASNEKKLNYYSCYQLSLMDQYQNYLTKLKERGCSEDSSTFSLVELQLDDENFNNFQNEFNELIVNYYKKNTPGAPSRTVGITIIPET